MNKIEASREVARVAAMHSMECRALFQAAFKRWMAMETQSVTRAVVEERMHQANLISRAATEDARLKADALGELINLNDEVRRELDKVA
jgi:hypothetical protein